MRQPKIALIDSEPLRAEIEAQQRISQALRLEVEILKEQVRARDDLLRWTYQTTRDALMVCAQTPRLGREKRDQAISEINYKVGGFIR